MSVSRLADRRIRAEAAQAALRLDVRGPVSEALGKTGIVVPAEPPPASETPAPPASAPRSTARRVRARAAERVLKPFEPAPWPTAPRRVVESEAAAGLTGDERRVHRALIDALDKRDQLGLDHTGIAGLSYAERKRLQALDLAFINAELAKMDRPVLSRLPRVRVAFGILAAFGAGATAAVMLTGSGDANALTLATFVLIMASGLVEVFGLRASTPTRRRIYETLRELALLTNDPAPATATALRQSDRLIDQLTADASRTPRLGANLLDPPADAERAAASTAGRRVRS